MGTKYSARSHMGRVRKNNEDNLFVNRIILPEGAENRPFQIDGVADLPAIFAICDGMGGESYGELASRIAVSVLGLHYEGICHSADHQLTDKIASYVNDVHEAVCESVGTHVRTGTTLALAVISKNRTFCFNSGDSRIYMLRRRRFQQITHDHTWIAEQQSKGIRLSAEDVKENRHKITRYIGTGELQKAEEYSPISGKCRLLLCSDGLTDMLNDLEIERIMRNCVSTASAADELISMALYHGGKDNITVIVTDTGNSHIFRLF